MMNMNDEYEMMNHGYARCIFIQVESIHLPLDHSAMFGFNGCLGVFCLLIHHKSKARWVIANPTFLNESIFDKKLPQTISSNGVIEVADVEFTMLRKLLMMG
jgi:hypothetical protein